jgi:hypothetical protein
MGRSDIRRRKPRRRLPKVNDRGSSPFASVPEPRADLPSPLTWEGMNARIGAAGGGLRSLDRDHRGRRGTWLAGQIIRAAVILMLGGLVVTFIVMAIASR